MTNACTRGRIDRQPGQEAPDRPQQDPRIGTEVQRHLRCPDEGRRAPLPVKAGPSASGTADTGTVKALETRIKPLADKGRASFEEAGKLAGVCRAAIRGLAKLDAGKV